MTLFDRFRTEPVYNTRAVVHRTGVPADTFRAWERRYGLPAPSRTSGNQRLYSERDVALIGWLRDQTREGMTISQAVAVYQSGDADTPPPPPVRTAAHPSNNGAVFPSPRLTEFRDRIVESLVVFDGGGADLVVEEAIALISVEDVCLHVLQAALIEIGERWQRNELSVGVEHFASNFVMRKFSALFNLYQPKNGRGPIIAACVEGEQHEIGLLLTCLFLSRHGFRILYLGANLPLDDLLTTVADVEPVLVLLSATTEPAALRLIEFVRALRGPSRTDGETWSHTPPHIGYGGRVFAENPELRARVDAEFLGTDASQTVASVERLFSLSLVN